MLATLLHALLKHMHYAHNMLAGTELTQKLLHVAQVEGLQDENSRLKDYISHLEQMHGSMSTELVSWRERFRTSTAKNAMLCQQLMDRKHGAYVGAEHQPTMQQVSPPSHTSCNTLVPSH